MNKLYLIVIVLFLLTSCSEKVVYLKPICPKLSEYNVSITNIEVEYSKYQNLKKEHINIINKKYEVPVILEYNVFYTILSNYAEYKQGLHTLNNEISLYNRDLLE